jgi:hypothetical protein
VNALILALGCDAASLLMHGWEKCQKGFMDVQLTQDMNQPNI